ncbi:MAG: UDP-galactopyranose mutase [Candidatus Omnitrophota bacterium]
MRFNYIIVGSGIYGSVLAERLYDSGKSVLVIDKRDHIGGNCYSYEYKDTNITVHKYGTHIFHTNDKRTWEYINRFTEFNRYQHRVLTTHNSQVYSMPINLATINAFYGVNLKPKDVMSFLAKKKKNFKNPSNLEKKAVSLIGEDLYCAFIKNYSIKQWGHDPRELPPETIARLPVRTSFHDSYFDDYYQGLPLFGYTAIFKNMLKKIPIELNTDFFARKDYWLSKCERLIYTGPLDRYFDYKFGKLRWRSVRFELEELNYNDYQGTSVMNFADLEVPFTRIHEPKHLHRERKFKPNVTVIIREYPSKNDQEPYYPVNSKEDIILFKKYNRAALREKDVIFGGRLAEYKYYDMHHAIEAALKRFDQIKKK